MGVSIGEIMTTLLYLPGPELSIYIQFWYGTVSVMDGKANEMLSDRLCEITVG